jgi:putative oxidoreductase
LLLRPESLRILLLEAKGLTKLGNAGRQCGRRYRIERFLLRHFSTRDRRIDGQFCFSAAEALASFRAVANNPVYSFFATRGSFAPLFIRLALAVVFFFHALQKTFGWFGGRGWSDTIALYTSAENYGLPYLLAVFFLFAQLAVPIALLFGFLTRLAALAVILMISGLLLFVQEVTSFDAVELPIVLIAAGLSLLITGGGYFSMDRAISVNLLPEVG